MLHKDVKLYNFHFCLQKCTYSSRAVPGMLSHLMLILFLCLGIMRDLLSNPLEVYVPRCRIWVYRLGCFPYKETLKPNSDDLKQ